MIDLPSVVVLLFVLHIGSRFRLAVHRITSFPLPLLHLLLPLFRIPYPLFLPCASGRAVNRTTAALLF